MPFGDIAAGIVAIGATFAAVGVGVYNTVTYSDNIPQDDVDENTKDKYLPPKKPDNTVRFPADPNDFNPLGLVREYRPGSKNGCLIGWMDTFTNTEVFRWDENPNYSNGPHYHIMGQGHYYAGDIVPEPYASIYFPFN